MGIHESYVRLLECLIMRGADAVHTKDLAQVLAGVNANEDTTRKAVDSFVVAVQRCFRHAKVEAPLDLAEMIASPRRGYYVLTVRGFLG